MIVLQKFYTVLSIPIFIIWLCNFFKLCFCENIFSTPIGFIDFHSKNGFFDQGAATEPKNYYLQVKDKNSGAYQQSSDDYKNEKDYKVNNKYDKLKKKSHEKNKHSKHYGNDGGKNKKDFDELSHYGKHHKKEKGQKSAKFAEKEGHKKGHKTKGYHNKFFKDEYANIRKIYDDGHSSGDHNKVQDQQQSHENQNGGYRNGGQHSSGYSNKHYGKNGQVANDNRSKSHLGTHGARGSEAYYRKQRLHDYNQYPRFNARKLGPYAYFVY